MNAKSLIVALTAAVVILTACGGPAQPGQAVEPAAAPGAEVDIAEAPTAAAAATSIPALAATDTAPAPTQTSSPEATETRRSILELDTSTLAQAAASDTPAAEMPGTAQALALNVQQGVEFLRPDPSSALAEPALDTPQALPAEGWQPLDDGAELAVAPADLLRVLPAGTARLAVDGQWLLSLKQTAALQLIDPALALPALTDLPLDPAVSDLSAAMQLFDGGLLAESNTGDSQALVVFTPDHTVIGREGQLFIAQDAASGQTWVANLTGDVVVADRALTQGEMLPSGEMIALGGSAERDQKPLPGYLTWDLLANLIEAQDSPAAAAGLIGGPHLVGVFEPELAVRSGPGSEFAYVGGLAQNELARIVGRGRNWWQIECLPEMSSTGECWVSGGAAYTDAYNTAGVPVTAQRATATPTPTRAPSRTPTRAITGTPMTATPQVTVPPDTAPGDVFDCSYIGPDKFEWYTAEGGPYTGTWQSGCPAAPSVHLRGCTVDWNAGNDNVTSMRISLRKVGTVGGNAYERTDEFGAPLPGGSQGFTLPAGFVGEVTASLNVQLDNGASDSKRDTGRYESQCAE